MKLRLGLVVTALLLGATTGIQHLRADPQDTLRTRLRGPCTVRLERI